MANKLSKAQQEVVDKMREGSTIQYINGLFPRAFLNPAHKRLNIYTFYNLKRMGLIEACKTIGICTDYQLTEKYRK